MNYYIQGDAANADKIKAAFEKLGYDTKHYTFDNDNLLFYTINGDYIPFLDGRIMREAILINIIKTHPDYKELELPIEFKDGDIIGFNDCTHNDGSYIDWVGIYMHQSNDFINHQHFFHCVATSKNTFRIGGSWRVFTAYPATKEQRDLLFRKMREAGYQWDEDKKELRKIQPHYDIENFKPFDKVLTRFCDGANWCCALFSHYCPRGNCHFVCSGGSVTQCIPFNEKTKHLLGTTDMCDECYVNW